MKNKILYGGDYNPEQWLDYPEILERDIELLKEAKINTVTLGMFSWSTLEPKEGVFNFQWLEKVIKTLEENEINVILGTPSGAKPTWLGNRYEEIRVVRNDGVRELQGNRHNFCTNSKIYREKIAIINEKLARLALKHKNIILWHISNEFGADCHCQLCQEKFRVWLKEKYGTIENLNKMWWTTFWSHTYGSFDEINTPMTIGEMSITALDINYRQFMVKNYIDYFNFEKSCIEKVGTNLPFTTNYHGVGNTDMNYREFSKYVDIISYDSYPEWMIKNNLDVAFETSFNFDLMRSTDLKKPFMLMESSPSSTNWQRYSKLKPNNLLEMVSLQSVAHSSLSVLYFQIRQSRGSAEKFHGAVIDHSGKSTHRVYDEVKKLGETLDKLDYKLKKVETKVAVYYSWLNKYALERSQGPRNEGMDYYKNVLQIYRVLKSMGINIDIVFEDSKLDQYTLVIMPMMYVVEKEFADEIGKFVSGGGTIVTTGPIGYVNSDDLCHLGGFPGYLKEVLGIEVDEIDALTNSETGEVYYKGEVYTSKYFNEMITLGKAKSLGTYNKFFYKNQVAISENSYGAGKAYHVGTLLEKDGLYALFGDIFKELSIECAIDNSYLIYSSYLDRHYVFNFGEKSEIFKFKGVEYKLESLEYIILD
ncbi:beta-galactosidase [Cetobacterium somerae]|uniref:beta-galactosidase n=1 Tax=Cetobacterium somerae TaxID=188913 RepID=UPI00211DD517|nr:beta-galactosidase [Cetobacterium somerae]MCQ9627923.1 beta-galactosidase [Cetobacterium somerae]